MNETKLFNIYYHCRKSYSLSDGTESYKFQVYATSIIGAINLWIEHCIVNGYKHFYLESYQEF